jgi:hypothetical protein
MVFSSVRKHFDGVVAFCLACRMDNLLYDPHAGNMHRTSRSQLSDVSPLYKYRNIIIIR